MKKIMALTLALALLLCWGAEAAESTGGAAGSSVSGEENEKQDKRYVKLFTDNYFNYYMDKKSAKWILCPNRSDEYIIDVWIKLERIEDTNAKSLAERMNDSQYVYQEKYYLEHYYVRPSTEQIQFLCELEVSGRPDNDISQRKYDIRNWEYLVPDSVEDSIYQAVVKKMGKKHSANGSGFDLGNMMEDVFRISV
ncbi:hypothetical protein [Anaerovibrio sp.]|uniref:hypothetical protein n=1 Tax=Anaerovibrio sp. TaxID=1872532 RepID=UPI003F18601C